MIKHSSFYDLTNERLVTCELDSDACFGTNEKVAAAICLSMKNLDPPRPSEPKRITNGLHAVAGGGRTRVAFAHDVRSLDRLAPQSSFFGVA